MNVISQALGIALWSNVTWTNVDVYLVYKNNNCRHVILPTSVELALFADSLGVRGEDQYHPHICMIDTELEPISWLA